MGGAHTAPAHIKLLISCAEICQVAVNFMARRSEFARQVCMLCAELCQACAASCNKLNDPSMQKCAEMCRRCAKACLSM